MTAWPTGSELVGWGALSALLGALVASAELLSRYRDAPFATLRTRYGAVYWVINGLASAGVFSILSVAHESIFPGIGVLSGALLSGFGAMAILRSKFFTFRTKTDEDIPVGVDAILKAFLQAADREIDRARAAERWETTWPRVHDFKTPQEFDDFASFLAANLKSYQGVTADEQSSFEAVLADLRTSSVAPALRCVAASLAFQAIVGSDNFRKVLEDFRERQ